MDKGHYVSIFEGAHGVSIFEELMSIFEGALSAFDKWLTSPEGAHFL